MRQARKIVYFYVGIKSALLSLDFSKMFDYILKQKLFFEWPKMKIQKNYYNYGECEICDTPLHEKFINQDF